MRVLVVGLGNRMYGDDGYGDLLAQFLEECGASGFDVFHGAHLGLGMLGYLAGYDVIVFIDIVERGLVEEGPGSVGILEIDPSKAGVAEYAYMFSRETDNHSVSPAHLIALLYAAGQYRGTAYIIGVVPESLEFGKPVSEPVKKATGRVLEMLDDLLAKLGLGNYTIPKDCVEEKMQRISGLVLD